MVYNLMRSDVIFGTIYSFVNILFKFFCDIIKHKSNHKLAYV